MIKKLIIITAIIAYACVCTAQTQKGKWMIGGSIGFSSISTTEKYNGNSVSETIITISPSVKHFVVKDFAVGAALSYVSIAATGSSNVSIVEFDPTIRYYFVPLGRNGSKLFSEAWYTFGSQSSGNTNIHVSGYGIKVGPAVFLNEHTAIEITLGYSTSTFEGNPQQNSIAMGVGFQIHI